MARSRRYPLKKFVHRVLIIRLGLAGAVLAVLFGLVTFYSERDRVSEKVVAHILKASDVFSARYRGLIDEPALPNQAAIRKALEEFGANYEESDIGRYVAIRIYGLKNVIVAEDYEKDYALIEPIKDLIGRIETGPAAGSRPRYETVHIGGAPHLITVTPLKNSARDTVGLVAGVFVPSPETVSLVRSETIRTMLYVMAIVLVTTALLYPVILRLTQRVSRFAVQLLDANLETLEILGNAIALRDSDTAAHNYRVTIMAVRLAEAVGLSPRQMRTLIKGAFLHDVGKIGIPDNVLLKPGKLTEDELAVMKGHVSHGQELVQESRWLSDALEVVGYHHEKVSGKGYTKGLKGEEIPITARIFAIVDVFDALTSRRPYKEPLSFEDTLTILEEGRGSHFDADLLDAFTAIAKSLFDRLSRSEELPREELERIVNKYFAQDVSLEY